MTEQEIADFEEAIDLLKGMVRRARMWAIISIVAGLVCIGIGFLLISDSDITKTVVSIGGGALSAIGFAWPLREIYNTKNRIEVLELFKKRYVGPPPASDEEKIQLKNTVNEIIHKAI